MKWFNVITYLALFLCVGLFALDSNAHAQVETMGLANMTDDRRQATGGIQLSLDGCVQHSVRNSFEVKKAKLDFYIAETDLMYKEAVFDTFLDVGLNYSEDKLDQLSVFAPKDSQTNEYYAGMSKTLPTGTRLGVELKNTRLWSDTAFISKNPSHTAALTFDAVQPIGKNMFGYVDRKNISLTKLVIENAGLDTKDRIEAHIAKTLKAYLDLVYAKRALEIYSGILERAQKLYNTDKKNHDIGLVEKVGLLASEANVAIIKADVILAKNNYKQAEETLKLIMNLAKDKRLIPIEGLGAGRMDRGISDCLKEAFQKRRDYLQAKRDIEIKGINLKIKKNEKWPEIDLMLSMTLNGVERKFNKAAGKVTVDDNTYYYAGVGVNVSIENKAARSEYLKAKLEKEKALIGIKEVERTIVTEVGNDYNDVTALQGSLIHISKAVELQAQKLNEEEKRFNYGRSSTKRLIDYQQDLLRAELEEAIFLRRYNKAKVDIDRTMNIILEKYEGAL